jgi:membrane-associated phospholipid phosphatase
MKSLYHKTSVLKAVRNWPFDKQLVVIFPTLVILTALFSGSLKQLEISGNHAAIFCIGLFFALVISFRILLNKHALTYRAEWFVREFWPILAILVSYLLMRVLRLELAIEYFSIPQRDQLMIQFDTLFFGQPIPLYIQHWISPTFTLLMETAYLHFYYLLPIGSLLYFYWLQQDQLYMQVRKAIIYIQVGGFLGYFMLPVKGPIDYIRDQFSIRLNSSHEIVYEAVNSFRFAYDCFPSLHTALPWAVLFVTWSWHTPFMRLIMLFMACSITLSTMYLRYHYGADVLAGFLWACLVGFIVKSRSLYLPYGTIKTGLSK